MLTSPPKYKNKLTINSEEESCNNDGLIGKGIWILMAKGMWDYWFALQFIFLYTAPLEPIIFSKYQQPGKQIPIENEHGFPIPANRGRPIFLVNLKCKYLINWGVWNCEFWFFVIYMTSAIDL